METEIKGCVLDIHFVGETQFDLRWLFVVEKSVTNKCQSKTSTPATPCFCKYNREHALYSTTALKVILRLLPLGIYIEGEVFEKMTNECPSLLAPGDKIVLIIAFGRRFLVKLPPKRSWLSQKTLDILPSDGVILYTDGSQSRAGAGVFSETLDIREFYALGSLATVFQTEVYAIRACSNYCRSTNMHNMTICTCSDSKAAFLAPSSYKFLSKLLHQCWLSLLDLSNNNKVRMFWVSGHCDITGNEEADRLTTNVFHCQLQLSGI
jgi:ribonuclease HI